MMSTEFKELELKYFISKLDKAKIEEFLSSFKLQKSFITLDIYYDTENNTLFKRGIFVRNRDDCVLEFKLNADGMLTHDYCDEWSFRIPFEKGKQKNLNKVCKIIGLKYAESFRDFISVNKLCKFVIIDKSRKVYSLNGYTICFDEVKDLGYFIEVEKKIASLEDIENEKNKIEGLLENSKLKGSLEKIGTGYVELYLKKFNYGLYKIGKFL